MQSRARGTLELHDHDLYAAVEHEVIAGENYSHYTYKSIKKKRRNNIIVQECGMSRTRELYRELTLTSNTVQTFCIKKSFPTQSKATSIT
jgi:hypothetical protein